MKNVLSIICVILLLMLLFSGDSEENIYSREDMEEAIASAEQRGFENAYAEAEYYARGKAEQAIKEELYYLEAELEACERYTEDAYDAGYEAGYYACLEEHGLTTEEHGSAWIEKDRG